MTWLDDSQYYWDRRYAQDNFWSNLCYKTVVDPKLDDDILEELKQLTQQSIKDLEKTEKEEVKKMSTKKKITAAKPEKELEVSVESNGLKLAGTWTVVKNTLDQLGLDSDKILARSYPPDKFYKSRSTGKFVEIVKMNSRHMINAVCKALDEEYFEHLKSEATSGKHFMQMFEKWEDLDLFPTLFAMSTMLWNRDKIFKEEIEKE